MLKTTRSRWTIYTALASLYFNAFYCAVAFQLLELHKYFFNSRKNDHEHLFDTLSTVVRMKKQISSNTKNNSM